MNKLAAILVFFAALCAVLIQAEIRAKRAINPFVDSMGKRALNPFVDSIGKRFIALPEKKYFDSLAGQSLGKRSEVQYAYEPYF